MPATQAYALCAAVPGLIYALLDPRDGQIRYVGKTISSAQTRYDQHLRSARKPKHHRDFWIKQLLDLELVPELIQLDAGVWSKSVTDAREVYWINTLRNRGFDLTNKTLGGDGNNGIEWSEETLSRIGAATRRNWSTDSYREARTQSQQDYWSDNTRARDAVSRQAKTRWADPEYKKRLSSYRAVCLDCGYEANPPVVSRHRRLETHLSGQKRIDSFTDTARG